MSEVLSVIVPVYNGEKTLRRCVESLRTQTYPNLEILVIDDGSTDGTPAICDEYETIPEIRVIHQENRGLAATRNRGILEAKGDYIGFCDADDFVHPAMFAELYRILKEAKAEISVCGYVRAPEGAGELAAPEEMETYRVYPAKKALEKLLKGEEPLKSYAWNKLYKKELFRKIRYPEGKNFEDQFVTWRLFGKAEKIAAMDWKGYYYVDNPESITNRKWNPKELDYLEAWEEILRFFKGKNEGFARLAADQLVSAAIYTESRMKKAGITDRQAKEKIRRYIAENAEGYARSQIAAATPKRKAYAVLMGLTWRMTGEKR
ncbi:MAG: glycosyltransferase family 2 protein [Eubacteriales bacterium]|nr:glycosyltransferase family 2 protein [Eubacteriales bacterium]